ncbi:ArgS-related anticodon-binding protein NrtL [Streptomyces olivaceus]|uniref:ArgS-related anticodon-binding protein NrtL n=1 Tax=Streptomyces olivaceus TaxID=47716 RepID=UPI001884E99F|nr:DALR anticodon-binding domain-containing protein [Streptomyces olivaceus]
MTPVELSRTVLHAVRRAVDAGELSVAVPERAVVTPPGPGGCGDYATNIALQLARPAGQTPQRVAQVLRRRLVGVGGIADVVLTGPGFINISLDEGGGGAVGVGLVAEVLRAGGRYGSAERAGGAVVRLHCAREVRAVVVGEVVGRLLRAQGVTVRTSAEGVEPRWTDVLGVRVDGGGSASAEVSVNVRPVPVADPDSLLALGRDAGRWALLRPAGHDRVRGGAEGLVQREVNPLFRVRYVHARTRALARNAAYLGFAAEPGALGEAGADAERVLLAAPATLAALGDYPRVLAAAAEHRAPDRLARHLVAVADAALPLLPGVLPRGGEKPSAAHRARLALAEAVGAVLAGGLSLLGIDAPDHI